MAYVERTDKEIIAALERYVARHPKPDTATLFYGNRVVTLRKFLEGIKLGDPLFVSFCQFLRDTGKRLNIDPVEKIDQREN